MNNYFTAAMLASFLLCLGVAVGNFWMIGAGAILIVLIVIWALTRTGYRSRRRRRY